VSFSPSRRSVPSFHWSARIKPLLQVHLKALEHLFEMKIKYGKQPHFATRPLSQPSDFCFFSLQFLPCSDANRRAASRPARLPLTISVPANLARLRRFDQM
jgi:hypothetical protein